jgi:hypothetical protein
MVARTARRSSRLRADKETPATGPISNYALPRGRPRRCRGRTPRTSFRRMARGAVPAAGLPGWFVPAGSADRLGSLFFLSLPGARRLEGRAPAAAPPRGLLRRHRGGPPSSATRPDAARPRAAWKNKKPRGPASPRPLAGYSSTLVRPHVPSWSAATWCSSGCSTGVVQPFPVRAACADALGDPLHHRPLLRDGHQRTPRLMYFRRRTASRGRPTRRFVVGGSGELPVLTSWWAFFPAPAPRPRAFFFGLGGRPSSGCRIRGDYAIYAIFVLRLFAFKGSCPRSLARPLSSWTGLQAPSTTSRNFLDLLESKSLMYPGPIPFRPCSGAPGAQTTRHTARSYREAGGGGPAIGPGPIGYLAMTTRHPRDRPGRASRGRFPIRPLFPGAAQFVWPPE